VLLNCTLVCGLGLACFQEWISLDDQDLKLRGQLNSLFLAILWIRYMLESDVHIRHFNWDFFWALHWTGWFRATVVLLLLYWKEIDAIKGSLYVTALFTLGWLGYKLWTPRNYAYRGNVLLCGAHFHPKGIKVPECNGHVWVLQNHVSFKDSIPVIAGWLSMGREISCCGVVSFAFAVSIKILGGYKAPVTMSRQVDQLITPLCNDVWVDVHTHLLEAIVNTMQAVATVGHVVWCFLANYNTHMQASMGRTVIGSVYKFGKKLRDLWGVVPALATLINSEEMLTNHMTRMGLSLEPVGIMSSWVTHMAHFMPVVYFVERADAVVIGHVLFIMKQGRLGSSLADVFNRLFSLPRHVAPWILNEKEYGSYIYYVRRLAFDLNIYVYTLELLLGVVWWFSGSVSGLVWGVTFIMILEYTGWKADSQILDVTSVLRNRVCTIVDSWKVTPGEIELVAALVQDEGALTEVPQVQEMNLYRVGIVRYGSAGDHNPLIYIGNYLRTLGIEVEELPVSSPADGIKDLHQLEFGNIAASFKQVRRLCNKTVSSAQRNGLTICPIFAQAKVPHAIHVAYTDHRAMFAANVDVPSLDIWSHLIALRMLPLTHFSSTAGSWPYSPNGRDVVTYLGRKRPSVGDYVKAFRIWLGSGLFLSRFKVCRTDELWDLTCARFCKDVPHDCVLRVKRILGFKTHLVATGSAGVVDRSGIPQGADYHVSVAPGMIPSGAYVEPNKSHLEVMRNYSDVWTHGGAGTLKSGIACGAKVHSLSTLIDRNIRGGGGVLHAALLKSNHSSILSTFLSNSPLFGMYVLGSSTLRQGPAEACYHLLTILAEFPCILIMKAAMIGCMYLALSRKALHWIFVSMLSPNMGMLFMFSASAKPFLIRFFAHVANVLLAQWFIWPVMMFSTGFDWYDTTWLLFGVQAISLMKNFFISFDSRLIEAIVGVVCRPPDESYDRNAVTLYLETTWGIFKHSYLRVGNKLIDSEVSRADMHGNPHEKGLKTMIRTVTRDWNEVRIDTTKTNVVMIPLEPDEFVFEDLELNVDKDYGVELNCLSITFLILLRQRKDACAVVLARLLYEICKASPLLAIVSFLRLITTWGVDLTRISLNFPRFGSESRKKALIAKHKNQTLTRNEIRELLDQKIVPVSKGKVRTVEEYSTWKEMEKPVQQHHSFYIGTLRSKIEAEKKQQKVTVKDIVEERTSAKAAVKKKTPKKASTSQPSGRISKADKEDTSDGKRKIDEDKQRKRTENKEKKERERAKNAGKRDRQKKSDREEDYRQAQADESQTLADESDIPVNTKPDGKKIAIEILSHGVLNKAEFEAVLPYLNDVGAPLRVTELKTEKFGRGNTFDHVTVKSYHGFIMKGTDCPKLWRTAMRNEKGVQQARRIIYHGLRLFKCPTCNTPSGWQTKLIADKVKQTDAFGNKVHKFNKCCYVLPSAKSSYTKDPSHEPINIRKQNLTYLDVVVAEGALTDAQLIMRGYSALINRPVQLYLQSGDILLPITTKEPIEFEADLDEVKMVLKVQDLAQDATRLKFYAIKTLNLFPNVVEVVKEDYRPAKKIVLEPNIDERKVLDPVRETWTDTIARWLAQFNPELHNSARWASAFAIRSRVWHQLWTWFERAFTYPLSLMMLTLEWCQTVVELMSAGRKRTKPGIPAGTGFESYRSDPRSSMQYTLHPNPVAPHIIIPSNLGEDEPLVQAPIYYENKSWEYEDIRNHELERIGQSLALATNPMHVRTDYRRRVNRMPYIDDYITWRQNCAIQDLSAMQGTNSAVYANPEVKLESLQRYAKKPRVHELDREDMMEYVRATREHMPELYNGFQLLSIKSALKTLKPKVAPGYGWEGAADNITGKMRIRKRHDIFKDKELLKQVTELARQDLESQHLKPMIHTSFPKDYKDFIQKLELNPLKIRTVVAPSLVELIADKAVFHTIDQVLKYSWRESDYAIGMPFLGQAINLKLAQMPPACQRFVLDFTEFDATHPDVTASLIGELYGPGFNSLTIEEQEIVARQIEARWLRYQSGGYIEEMEDGFTVPHIRGSTTGSVQVTRTNVEVARYVIFNALKRIAELSYDELYKRTDRLLLGDDGMLQLRDFTVDPDLFSKVMNLASGIKVKIEHHSVGVGGAQTASWHGAKFLSHYIFASSAFSEELEMAGLDTSSPVFPRWVIQYDPQRAAMRQTVEIRRLTDYQLYDNAISYMQKSLHNEGLYRLARAGAEKLAVKLSKTERGRRFLAKRPIKSYHELMIAFYTKVSPLLQYRQRPDTWHAAFARGINTSYRVMAGFSTAMRYISVNHLGSPRTGVGAKGFFKTGAYIVEGYAFAMAQKENLNVPYNRYNHFLQQNAFASTTFPKEGYDYWKSCGAQDRWDWFHNARMQWTYGVFMCFRALWNFLVSKSRMMALISIGYYIIAGSPRDWWGIISTVGVLGYAQSSPFLSALIPKDPYRLSKNISVLIVGLLPPPIFVISVPQIVFQKLADVLEAIAHICSRRSLIMSAEEDAKDVTDDPTWDRVFHSAILPALASKSIAVVHAPTGTGKSAVLGNLLRTQYDQVVYVEARVSVASGMKGFRFIQRGIPFPFDAGKFTCTAAHLLQKKKTSSYGSTTKRVYVWDEYDEGDPASCLLFHELQSEGYKILLLSATRNDRIIQDMQVPGNFIIDVPIAPPYAITPMPPVRSGSLLEQISESLYKYNGRILVILTTVKQCSDLLEELEALDIEAAMFARGTVVPATRVIVATQIAEKGITLPGVKVVIDCGEMMRNNRGQLTLMRSDLNTSQQRRGRTGRTCSGYYICMKPPCDLDVVQYPDISLFFENPMFFCTRMLLEESFEAPLTNDDALALTAFVSIRISVLPAHWQSNEIARLLGMILLRCNDKTKLDMTFKSVLLQRPEPGVEDLAEAHDKAVEIIMAQGIEVAMHHFHLLVSRKPLVCSRHKSIVNFSTAFLQNGLIHFDLPRPPILDIRHANVVIYQPGEPVPDIFKMPPGSSFRRFEYFIEEEDVTEHQNDEFWALTKCDHDGLVKPITRLELREWVKTFCGSYYQPERSTLVGATEICKIVCEKNNTAVALYYLKDKNFSYRTSWRPKGTHMRFSHIVYTGEKALRYAETGVSRYIKWSGKRQVALHKVKETLGPSRTPLVESRPSSESTREPSRVASTEFLGPRRRTNTQAFGREPPSWPRPKLHGLANVSGNDCAINTVIQGLVAFSEVENVRYTVFDASRLTEKGTNINTAFLKAHTHYTMDLPIDRREIRDALAASGMDRRVDGQLDICDLVKAALSFTGYYEPDITFPRDWMDAEHNLMWTEAYFHLQEHAIMEMHSYVLYNMADHANGFTIKGQVGLVSTLEVDGMTGEDILNLPVNEVVGGMLINCPNVITIFYEVTQMNAVGTELFHLQRELDFPVWTPNGRKLIRYRLFWFGLHNVNHETSYLRTAPDDDVYTRVNDSIVDTIRGLDAAYPGVTRCAMYLRTEKQFDNLTLPSRDAELDDFLATLGEARGTTEDIWCEQIDEPVQPVIFERVNIERLTTAKIYKSEGDCCWKGVKDLICSTTFNNANEKEVHLNIPRAESVAGDDLLSEAMIVGLKRALECVALEEAIKCQIIFVFLQRSSEDSYSMELVHPVHTQSDSICRDKPTFFIGVYSKHCVLLAPTPYENACIVEMPYVIWTPLRNGKILSIAKLELEPDNDIEDTSVLWPIGLTGANTIRYKPKETYGRDDLFHDIRARMSTMNSVAFKNIVSKPNKDLKDYVCDVKEPGHTPDGCQECRMLYTLAIVKDECIMVISGDSRKKTGRVYNPHSKNLRFYLQSQCDDVCIMEYTEVNAAFGSLYPDNVL